MAYIITEACIKCKHTDCVQICPTDCFHEGKNMLVIDPEKCIDCGLCEIECPPRAIIHQDADKTNKWLAINKKYAAIWPEIIYKKDALPDAEQWLDVANKYELYFEE